MCAALDGLTTASNMLRHIQQRYNVDAHWRPRTNELKWLALKKMVPTKLLIWLRMDHKINLSQLCLPNGNIHPKDLRCLHTVSHTFTRAHKHTAAHWYLNVHSMNFARFVTIVWRRVYISDSKSYIIHVYTV